MIDEMAGLGIVIPQRTEHCTGTYIHIATKYPGNLTVMIQVGALKNNTRQLGAVTDDGLVTHRRLIGQLAILLDGRTMTDNHVLAYDGAVCYLTMIADNRIALENNPVTNMTVLTDLDVPADHGTGRHGGTRCDLARAQLLTTLAVEIAVDLQNIPGVIEVETGLVAMDKVDGNLLRPANQG
ncbi:hypothetical protein D3C80_1457640 [compost metagenome]